MIEGLLELSDGATHLKENVTLRFSYGWSIVNFS